MYYDVEAVSGLQIMFNIQEYMKSIRVSDLFEKF